jgi:Rrf2 family iron-sulfur cluster assembly transcriptional regulator
VRSVRGPGGGYHLGKSPALISVAEVIEAVNESTDATRCHGKGNCQKGATCLTHHLWLNLSDQIHEFLQGISLSDLVERQDIQEIALVQHERTADADPGSAKRDRLIADLQQA